MCVHVYSGPHRNTTFNSTGVSFPYGQGCGHKLNASEDTMDSSSPSPISSGHHKPWSKVSRINPPVAAWRSCTGAVTRAGWRSHC